MRQSKMQPENNILNYFAETNAAFIHARGKQGTNLLISELDCIPGESILEIGFGTGATLLRLIKKYKQTKFQGMEHSEIMFRKALRRFKFSRVNAEDKLRLMKSKTKIPFKDNSFDKIYLESVLAINEINDIELLLSEIKRVLKPAGILMMNETIWLTSTTRDEIIEINEFCLKAFGIIQCNGLLPYLENWEILLKNKGFKIESIKNIDTHFNRSFHLGHDNLLSTIFTFSGRLKSKLSPQFRKKYSHYRNAMKTISESKNHRQIMSGYFIKACMLK